MAIWQTFEESRKMKKYPQALTAVVLLTLFAAPGKDLSADETKTFVAYSMKMAQARVEEAIEAGEDFRKKQPDLYYLGGITKPWAVVLDTQSSDCILVGERDAKSSILTLDDWVVGLRARFIHPEKDPGVTIDPRPCEECLKAGKRESCSHYTKQDVRFFAGIENTHFGQVCYEADWLMKKIGLGLERLPIEGFKTYYDLALEQHRNAGTTQSRVCSRFWFYPIVNRVNVIGDVVLLERFQMGVFTEVLYAELDGSPVADLDRFDHYPSEGFSRSFSDNYDAAAGAREVLETLRGLTRLAALAKGLTQADRPPDAGFYLIGYPLEKPATRPAVDVLKVEHREAGFEISGGVSLMALAMRLKGGDVGALEELVLRSRPARDALSWGFAAEMRDGHFAGVTIPEELTDLSQITPLFQQAGFLSRKGRYDAAIECYTQILSLVSVPPQLRYAVLINRSNAYSKKAESAKAFAGLQAAMQIDSDWPPAYYNRGLCHVRGGEHERAVTDFNKVIAIWPRFMEAYLGRAAALTALQRYEDALRDCNTAVTTSPECAEAYAARSRVYGSKGDLVHALSDADKAIGINPQDGELRFARLGIFLQRGEYSRAREELAECAALGYEPDPRVLTAAITFVLGVTKMAESGQGQQMLQALAAAIEKDSPADPELRRLTATATYGLLDMILARIIHGRLDKSGLRAV